MSRRMVLLVGFGGPRSETEIPLFLTDLMGAPPAAAFADGAMERYTAIGGFSPLPAITEELARLVAARSHPDIMVGVKAVFMYSRPKIEEGIRECLKSGVAEIAFFILSPYYNTKTTRAYIGTAKDSLMHLTDYQPATVFIHSWFAHPLFIDWWARKVQKAAELSTDAVFLFSAHSMPLSEVLYREQVEETVRLIAEKIGLSSYSLAWQSTPLHAKEEWMGPSVELVLDSLARRGVRKVIQVPIGFLIDNLETLYDIDITHRRYAEELGIDHRRLACPNTDFLFLGALWEILIDSLKGFQ